MVDILQFNETKQKVPPPPQVDSAAGPEADLGGPVPGAVAGVGRGGRAHGAPPRAHDQGRGRERDRGGGGGRHVHVLRGIVKFKKPRK